MDLFDMETGLRKAYQGACRVGAWHFIFSLIYVDQGVWHFHHFVISKAAQDGCSEVRVLYMLCVGGCCSAPEECFIMPLK